MVAALEQGGDQVAADLNFIVAQLVEQVLQRVGELLDVMNFHHAGTALDGVGGAENAVDGFRIAVALLHAQQTGFHLREVFA